MRKLVRDKTAANLLQENSWCGSEDCDHSAHPCRYGAASHKVYAIDNDDDYSAVLAAKLDEEVAELKRERNLPKILEELADVFEVLTSIAKFCGYSQRDLLDAYRKKNHQCGGFDNRMVLEQ